MMEIKELAEKIKEELHDAKNYAKCYQKHKADNSITAKRYLEMANDELKHAMYLHDMAVEKINEIKSMELDVPEYMLVLWDEVHERYIDKVVWIKNILSM